MEETTVQNPEVNNLSNPPKSKSSLVLMITLVAVAILILGIVAYVIFLAPKTTKNSAVNQSPTNNKQVDQVSILLNQPVSGIYPNIPDENNDQGFNTNLFDGLVNYRNGKIINALAESYVTVDANTWRFNLRHGVKFNNGSAFTAKDVKFSAEEAVKNKWPIFSPLTQISTITVIDDYTVEIKTKKPVPALINLLTGLPILSQDQFVTKAKTDYAIGTGPYKLISFDVVKQKVTNPDTSKLEEVTSHETITLEANPNYFGGRAKVNKIIYHFFDDNSLAKMSAADIKNGYQIVDGNTTLMPATFSALLAADYQKISVVQPNVRTLFLNEKAGPNKYVSTPTNPFANQKVRKAFYLAINPAEIIKEATVSGRPATQLVSSFIYGYNPNITRPVTDIVTAKSLLKEAGFENGFTVTLDLPGNRMAQGSVIAKQLAAIGITVNLNPLAKGPGLQKILSADYALFFSSWASDYFDATTTFTEALATGGIQNVCNCSNKAIDDKVKEINNLQDPIARQKALQEAMLIAMDDLGWIPLWEDQGQVYIASNLTYTSYSMTILGYAIGVK